MKTFYRIRLLIIAFAVILFYANQSCKSNCNCNSIDKNKIDGNLLYRICNYIKEKNLNIHPGDPCKLSITGKVKDAIADKSVTRLKLSCCYMGDEVIIDDKTDEIINYITSPK